MNGLYNVSKNREERAIAGLSMGGAETLYTALNHLDRFAWIGSFSGAFVMWPGANPTPPAGAAPPAAAPAAGAARHRRQPLQPGGPAGPPAAGEGGRGRGRGAARTIDPAVFDKNFPTLDAKANSRIKMLWITCGTADSLIAVNRQFKDWLRSKNVQFTELETPDVGHVWPYWRQNFTEFASKAFQK